MYWINKTPQHFPIMASSEEQKNSLGQGSWLIGERGILRSDFSIAWCLAGCLEKCPFSLIIASPIQMFFSWWKAVDSYSIIHTYIHAYIDVSRNVSFIPCMNVFVFLDHRSVYLCQVVHVLWLELSSILIFKMWTLIRMLVENLIKPFKKSCLVDHTEPFNAKSIVLSPSLPTALLCPVHFRSMYIYMDVSIHS